jgi:hypothetical protein
MIRSTNKRSRAVEMTRRSVLEALEMRQLLSVVSVSTNAQLQSAIASAAAGTQIDLAAGDYSGFQLSASGTSSAPIVIQGTTGTVITGNPSDSNGEIDISGCSYVTLDNLDVEMNDSTATRAGIWGGGEAGDNVNGLTIENCTVANSDWWNVLLGFVNNSTIEDNTLNGTLAQHDLYIGNSSNDDTVQGNLLENAACCGLEINEDATQGGPGSGGGFVINGNTFYNDASADGASLNFDGVQDSTIENNLIYGGQRNGIALYQINGALPSTGNVIVNNTIDVNSSGPAGYAAISLIDGAADCTILNNILSSDENSLNVDPTSQVGLVSDSNIFSSALIDPSGNGDPSPVSEGGSALSLSGWQALGFDKNSLEVSNVAGLFVSPTTGNFQLASGSAALGAGTTTDAPTTDITGATRTSPISIGAYQGTGTTTSQPPAPVLQPPTAASQSFTFNEGAAISGNALAGASDPQGLSLTAQLDGSAPFDGFTLAANGTISGSAPTTPGTYNFQIEAVDSDGLVSSPVTDSITVAAPVPQPPTAASQSFTFNEGDAISGNVLTGASDPQGLSLTAQLDGSAPFAGFTLAANGTISGSAPTTPGTYNFQIEAVDSDGLVSSPVTDSITVSAPAPVLPTLALTGPSTATVGQAVTVAATSTPGTEAFSNLAYYVNGALIASESGSSGTASYTFKNPSAGGDTFTCVGTYADGTVTSNAVTVIITPPSVQLSGASTAVAGQPVTVTASSTDLTITSFSFSINGISEQTVPATETVIDGVAYMTASYTFTFKYASWGGDTFSATANGMTSNPLLAVVEAL